MPDDLLNPDEEADLLQALRTDPARQRAARVIFAREELVYDVAARFPNWKLERLEWMEVFRTEVADELRRRGR